MEEKHDQKLALIVDNELEEFARVTRDLRRDLEHERERRRELGESVRQLESDHTNAQLAGAHLENRRSLRSLSDELSKARQEIVNLVHGQKRLSEAFERSGYLRHSKKPRTERRDEDVPRKT